MSNTISLDTGDGHRLQAYEVSPGGEARGGLVIAQEIFGVNAHIRRVADGYAADGYHVVTPALFDRVERGLELGYDDAGIARGRELKSSIALEPALADLAAACERAGAAGPVAVIGYCWGGLLAWGAAARIDGVAATVCYYGGGIAAHLQLAPRCPVLLHFGEHDQAIPLSDVDAVRAAYPRLPVHLYPAGHGFNCDARGSFHAESATLARERTLDFLGQHMG